MKRILVTGVTGTIGANLAARLITTGYEVRGLVMPGDPREAKADTLGVEKVVCDLRDLDGLTSATKGVDAVAHLAAAMGKLPGMSDRDYFDVNVTGTWQVIHAASRSAPNLERFLFASTDAVYSAYQADYVPMDERHPQRSYFPYGMVKILGEQVVEHYRRQENVPTVICRFGTVLANAELPGFFTAKFAVGLLKGAATDRRTNLWIEGIKEPWKPVEEAVKGDLETLVIPRRGDGTAWFHNFTDVRDTVAGAVLALEQSAAVGETFNIHAGAPIRWDEAVPYLAGKTGKRWVEVSLPNHLAFSLDVSKARRMLGYDPRFGYREMIDHALAVAARQPTDVIPS
jgi:nucleoside-diphosphate-sugar epimerase